MQDGGSGSESSYMAAYADGWVTYDTLMENAPKSRSNFSPDFANVLPLSTSLQILHTSLSNVYVTRIRSLKPFLGGFSSSENESYVPVGLVKP